MTIYNFNHGIGWASSGVEYAQAYRSNIFKKNKQDAQFIFTDLFLENLQPMTENIGFDDGEIIWLYGYFTDVKISPTRFGRQDLEATFPKAADKVEEGETQITYSFNDNHMRMTAFLDKKNKDKIYRTEIVVAGKLIQRDYYTYTKTFSEYFKPVNNQANIYQRRFFNENGSVAYDELINGKESLYIFSDRTIYSKEALIQYFVECLDLTEQDILIIDRSTGMGPQIIRASGPAKVGIVIHAEHFSESFTTDKQILWNNFYDYQFENASVIDFFITATERQKEVIEDQFKKYNKGEITIYTLPVGSIDELKKASVRKKNSLITASRLAAEKHIDWQIKAVVEARKKIKDLTLDIYGYGGEGTALRQLIKDLGAESYICLMGQHDLTDVYKNYQTYVATSTSEGFGLTLLEAVGSGLGMIGFDVPYGNQTFIHPGQNGYLLDYDKNNRSKAVEDITRAIIAMQEKDEAALHLISQSSYDIAKKYLTEEIQKMWLKLEQEVIKQ
ncbi:accessory Sec system glycosyltransferase GtfA [Lactococcus muris]|uniref:UDP-N-acetylglucosamine--peptide N-acetylglucosaminyltransferase GtfA subunit n=1 Tax=Lactococcus muris TaxID=2941330 RepID=A0ABV4DBF0_9LACT